MVSADKVRLLSSLTSETVTKFEPAIDEQGQVEYEKAREIVDSKFETPSEALNLLTNLGLLNKEYTIKVYVCPTCQEEGMQYIVACPHCEATHTLLTTFFEHELCGHRAPSTEFETDEDGAYFCPDCETEFDSSNLTIEETHHCQECDEQFRDPSHRLWCRDCLNLHLPEEARERTLYEYTLSEKGANWYESQTRARELLADQLESRGFDVTIDTDLQTEEETTYPVHIYAEDDLLDQRIVADVHSTIDPGDVDYIGMVAQQVNADPVLLTTDTTLPDEAESVAKEHTLTVLRIERDGTISRFQSFDRGSPPTSNLVDRLTTAVSFSSWNKRQEP